MNDKEKYLQDIRRTQREKAFARDQKAGLDAYLAQNAPVQMPTKEGGMANGEYNDTIGNGFWGHLKDSADAGFFGSLAGTARFAGEFSPVGNEFFESMADSLDERVRQNTPIEELTGSDYFAAAVGNALGSGAAGMMEGAILIGIGSAVGSALVPAGTAVGVYRTMRSVPVLGRLVKATRKMWKSNFGKMQLAEVAGSPIEGTAEAGNLITEMRQEGYSDEEIRSAALQSAKYNTAWLTVANMVGGRINNAVGSEGIKAGLKGATKAAVKGALSEGTGEAVQEYGQSYIHDAAKGVEFDPEEAEAAALQAFVGSAFLGGVGGVAKPYINNINTKTETETPETTPTVPDEQADGEGDAEANATLELAKEEIIGYRETFNEGDSEYGRLSELLANGSDEEILDEATRIRDGIASEIQNASEGEQQEVAQQEAPQVEGDTKVVEQQAEAPTEVPVTEQQTTTNAEAQEPAKTQEVVEPIKEEQPKETPASKPKNVVEEISDRDLPPSLDETMEGLSTEPPKSSFQKAQEEIGAIRKQEQQERLDEQPKEVKPQQPVTPQEEVDDYGFKKNIGEYEGEYSGGELGRSRRYVSKDGKTKRLLEKNDDDSFRVESVAVGKDLKETVTENTFQSIEDAENFIRTGKLPKGKKLKTYWASVRDKANNIKVLKMAYHSMKDFENELRSNGYRVRVISVPSKFDKQVKEFYDKTEAYNKVREEKKQNRQQAKKTVEENLKPNFTVIEVTDTTNQKSPETMVDRTKNLRIFSKLVGMLRKTGINIYTSPTELAKAATKARTGAQGKVVIENNVVYVIDAQNNKFMLNGLADSNTNTIYLNLDAISLHAPVHEYTHIWSKILRETNPELWAKGVELLKQTPKWQEIKDSKAYNLKGDDAIADEVLSWIVGERSEKLFEEFDKKDFKKDLRTQLKAWLQEFWSALKSFFEVHGYDNVKDLTLDEFLNMPLKDLASGKKISEIKAQAIMTSSAKSRFGKANSEGEEKLKNYLKFKRTRRSIQKAFANEKNRTFAIEAIENQPELRYDKTDNGNSYYARYKGRGKFKKIDAVVYHAIQEITQVTPQPWIERPTVVEQNKDKTPQELILEDTNLDEFIDVLVAQKSKYRDQAKTIKDVLNSVDESSGKSVSEQIREAVAQDYGTGEDDAYYEIDFSWLEDEFSKYPDAGFMTLRYYNYLAGKYATKKSSDADFMLVPVKNEPTNNKKVNELEKRLKKGESRLKIWEETGWYKAQDGYWKYVIDDDINNINFADVSDQDGRPQHNTKTTVGEIYDNPKLFKEFPYLKNVQVVFKKTIVSHKRGSSNDNEITIYINRNFDLNEAKRTLLHEIEHQIQDQEGMATGSSASSIAQRFDETVDGYWNKAGEISKRAQEYFYDYFEWLDSSINPFKKTFSKQSKADNKAALEESKAKFMQSASSEDKKQIKDLMSKTRTLYVRLKKSLQDETHGNNGFNQAYLNTLGEEEARLVASQANISLSDKDKAVKDGLLDALRNMSDEDAMVATNYLYYMSDASHTETGSPSGESQAWELQLKELGYENFIESLQSADNEVGVANSLAHLNFIMGHDDRSIVFFDDKGKARTVKQAVESAGIPFDNTSETLYQLAYHGSPHIFDQFSLEHIGEGEGAQAHGWGLYFAQDENVATKYYRDRLSGRKAKIILDGKTYENSIDGWTVDGQEEPLYGTDGIVLRDTLEAISKAHGDLKEAIKLVERDLEMHQKLYDAETVVGEAFLYEYLVDVDKKVLGLLQSDKVKDFTYKLVSQGSIFEVLIPNDNVLIDEDKPFSEQSLEVQQAIKEIIGTDYEPIFQEAMEIAGATLTEKHYPPDKVVWSEHDIRSFVREMKELGIDVSEEEVRELREGRPVPEEDRKPYTILERLKEELEFLDYGDVWDVAGELQEIITTIGHIWRSNPSVRLFARKLAFVHANKLNKLNELEGRDLYYGVGYMTQGLREESPKISVEQLASKALNQKGIKGITYDGDRDGRCFVIFDDAAIEIKRRYDAAIQKHQEEMSKVVKRNDEELRQALPNGKFERLDNGDYMITMPNGAKFQASVSGQIIVNQSEQAKAKEAHGLEGDNVVIRGSWEKITSAMCNGFLKLSDSARRGTAFHEVFHAVWDLALSQKEKDALLKHFQPIADRLGKDVHEVMADAFAAWMRKRAIEKTGTAFNKLWQKLVDQVKRLQAWFTGVENTHNVMRRIELGEVWNQPMQEAVDGVRYSATAEADSLIVRGAKAVTTKKPKSFQDDVKANGFEGWAKQMFRKFYRNMVDKNVDIKDFDGILSSALGRALTVGESIYNKVQMVTSSAAGLTTALIEGNASHIKAINSKLKRVKLKHNVTLANVLDHVNAQKMNKNHADYLKKGGFSDWIEAFGAYLGWRRMAEMARLHRETFEADHAAWAERKKAREEWVANGRIGKEPQIILYEEWEAYQKAKKNAQRRWERAGKVGPNPAEDIKAQWLETHESEDAPPRVVGKEPEFVPYKTPQGNLTEAELKQLIKGAPAPFVEAAKMYYQLNDNILSIMEDAGMIDAKTHQLLNEKYRDYCPMIRDFSDTAAVDAFVESITAGGKGVANVSSTLKKIRAEGSERTIINPLESTVQTIAAVSNRAERNKAGQHLVRMMTKAEGLKGYIEKLKQPRHGTINADPKNCIFTIMFNGKKVAYKAHPAYYQAIVGYNLPTAGLFINTARTAAKCLRTGATMSPSFIVRNIFRDTITAGLASKNGFIPIIDTIRGAKELWKNPEFRAKFEASGVVSFNQYGSAESAYQNLTDLASGKNYTVYEPIDIIKGVFKAALKGKGIEALRTMGISLEQLSSFAESATRAGEFKKALAKGKTLEQAAYDAKEVTLDFTRSGIVGQQWNQMVPFFNACIQGGDKMIRLLYEDPMGVGAKILFYITVPSVALWAMNQGEDWYEELDPKVKYTHWCLPNGVRVPKPQEYGILFGSAWEAMLDQATKQNPRAMKEWAKGVKDVVTPSVFPTIVLPLIEWQTNYSFFKGRDLVPQRLQRMPDELQYSTGTSELSKIIGRHTYVSPIKIDNVVRGYTGTMGTFLWQTPDWFVAEKQGLPAKKLSEMQFIRDFNVTQANRNRYLNDFYELQQKANQQQAGYGFKGKPSGAVKAVRKAGQTISDLNKQIRVIETSDKYSPERKRELIDKKRERINRTAKIVVDKYGEEFL